MSTEMLILLIVVVVVVLLAIGLFAMMSSRRKAEQAEQDRAHAGQIRGEAAATGTAVRDSDLEAREAKIEADRARLEAEQAESRASEAQQGVQVEEARREDKFREADRVDPDVDHRSEGYTPDTTTAPDTRTAPTAGTGTQGAGDVEPGQRIDPETGRPVDETASTDGQRRNDRPT